MRARLMLWVSSVLVLSLGFSDSLPANRVHGAAPVDEQQAAVTAEPATPSHIYRLSAFRAIPGRLTDLTKLLTAPAAAGPNAGDFAVVFRHRQGHEWDLLIVEHMGERATVSVPAGAQAQQQDDSPMSKVSAWHGDTFAAGPPLEAFRQALALPSSSAGQGGVKGVYVISDYTAAPGHRGQLRQQLRQLATETPGRSVTLTHVEGAPWTFLHITRYDSWAEFAKDEEAQDAQVAAAAPGSGLAIREHMTMHHDTLAVVAGVVSRAP